MRQFMIVEEDEYGECSGVLHECTEETLEESIRHLVRDFVADDHAYLLENLAVYEKLPIKVEPGAPKVVGLDSVGLKKPAAQKPAKKKPAAKKPAKKKPAKTK